MNNYNMAGTITCMDGSSLLDCSSGGLSDGLNIEDTTYNQPLNHIEFSDDWSTILMAETGGPEDTPDDYGVETPSRVESRNWLSLSGNLRSMELTPTPDCLCE
jgi:hypothetical protein